MALTRYTSGWGIIPIGPFSPPRRLPVEPSSYTAPCEGCGRQLVMHAPGTRQTLAPPDTRTGLTGRALWWCAECAAAGIHTSESTRRTA